MSAGRACCRGVAILGSHAASSNGPAWGKALKVFNPQCRGIKILPLPTGLYVAWVLESRVSNGKHTTVSSGPRITSPPGTPVCRPSQGSRARVLQR